MTHIIILAHFACITIGSILFYELLRNVKFQEKQKFLIAGIGGANLSFILDTFNIYCRHWYKGYALNDVIEIVCIFLFYLSFISLLLYLILLGKREHKEQKSKGIIIIGSICLFCVALQMISNIFECLKLVPWVCLGYFFFCIMQFVYLFTKQKEDATELSEKEEDSSLEKELLTARELEIANYICEGKSNKEIAELLFISQNTVRNHIYNIYKKIGVKNKVELINRLK